MTQDEINTIHTRVLPILGKCFQNVPLYFPLCENSQYYNLFANVPQVEFQKVLSKLIHENGTDWSISGYLENRSTFLRDYPQMVKEGRYYHLGIDISAPCGTKLFVPYDCEVVMSTYEKGDGNYGGLVVFKCKTDDEVFYLLFGHLNPERIPPVGAKLKKGDLFAEYGDMTQNGGWFFHTHIQVLTQKAFDEG